MQRVVFVLLVAVNAAAALQAQADESGDAVADGAVSTSRETAPPAAAIESLCCRPSAFTVDVDTLCLQPARGNGVTLGRTFDVTNGNTLETLSSNDAGFDMQAGLRFRLLWQRDACTAWEGVYFGMQTWDGGSSITPDFAVAGTLADSPWTQTDKLVGGFDQSLSFHSMARLNNVEINRRRLLDCNCGASIEWLAGLRYIQWDESLTLDGLNSLPPAFEELEVRCQNQMVGPQIGAEVRRNWDHWYLTVEGKAALMANIYRQRRSNMNSSGVQPNGYPAIAPLDDDNSGGCVAGAVDLSIVAAASAWRTFLGPRWISIALSHRTCPGAGAARRLRPKRRRLPAWPNGRPRVELVTFSSARFLPGGRPIGSCRSSPRTNRSPGKRKADRRMSWP
ncbi:MAG: BBP7 family outer membrane beta-barrel protein [Thermoguttaceae bacterium]